jgi:hypothetical protein
MHGYAVIFEDLGRTSDFGMRNVRKILVVSGCHLEAVVGCRLGVEVK